MAHRTRAFRYDREAFSLQSSPYRDVNVALRRTVLTFCERELEQKGQGVVDDMGVLALWSRWKRSGNPHGAIASNELGGDA